MIDLLLIIIGSLGLIVGSITDFQKREVANWINFSLLALGFVLRFVSSLISNDWFYFLISLAWFGGLYIFANLMYYTGQWGGGDSKMILGLGVLFATFPLSYLKYHSDYLSYFFNLDLSYTISFMFDFLLNIFIVGAIYSLIYTFFLVVFNFKKFKQSFKKKFMEKHNLSLIIISSIIFIGGYIFIFNTNSFSFINQAILWMILIVPILIVYIRSVEESCMLRKMKLEDLTKGEWVSENIKKPHNHSFKSFYKSKIPDFMDDKLSKSFLFWFYKNFNLEKQKNNKILNLKKEFNSNYENLSSIIKKDILHDLFWKFKFKDHSHYKQKSLEFFEKEISSKHISDKNIKKLLLSKFGFDTKFEIVCGSKNLGITLKQISILKDLRKQNIFKKNFVKVKVGIPFVPAFLFAFIVTLFLGNILLYFLGFYSIV